MSVHMAHLLKIHDELVDLTIVGAMTGLPSLRMYHLDLKEFSQRVGCLQRCIKASVLVPALGRLKRYGTTAVLRPEFRTILITIDLSEVALTLPQAQRLARRSLTQ